MWSFDLFFVLCLDIDKFCLWFWDSIFLVDNGEVVVFGEKLSELDKKVIEVWFVGEVGRGCGDFVSMLNVLKGDFKFL